jgi:hypothetical protein
MVAPESAICRAFCFKERPMLTAYLISLALAGLIALAVSDALR